MTSNFFAYAFDAIAACAILIVLPGYIVGRGPIHDAIAHKLSGERAGLVGLCLGALSYPLIKLAFLRRLKAADGKKESMYGLQHGRLHLQVATPMWMNMGYWRSDYDGNAPESLAEACRNLLQAVLSEAGLSKGAYSSENWKDTRRRKMLLDLGIGCGDQTIYLMSANPVRPCDRDWWDQRNHCVLFDGYVGITKDATQARYAEERVQEMRSNRNVKNPADSVSIHIADAADPKSWNPNIQDHIQLLQERVTDHWVLALDTAYHFSPSRWPLIQHAHAQLQASFMAFDLCLSPSATYTQKVVLRILTSLMGAPWANFVTPDGYRKKLIEIGYKDEAIKIVDVSEHVFIPLATYLDKQDARLKTIGFGIGSFSVAKSLFSWWGRSGAVRGVIVVAER